MAGLTSNETSNEPRRTGQHEGGSNRTNSCHIAGLASTNERQPDLAGLPGRPSIELRIWSGDRLEVRVLSPAHCRRVQMSVDCCSYEGGLSPTATHERRLLTLRDGTGFPNAQSGRNLGGSKGGPIQEVRKSTNAYLPINHRHRSVQRAQRCRRGSGGRGLVDRYDPCDDAWGRRHRSTGCIRRQPNRLVRRTRRRRAADRVRPESWQSPPHVQAGS